MPFRLHSVHLTRLLQSLCQYLCLLLLDLGFLDVLDLAGFGPGVIEATDVVINGLADVVMNGVASGVLK